ncbi:S8 family serine peptidase [Spirulina subsalsa]|nr:S8 family serine peptidase [Spirulina subsalsa]
MRPGDEFAFMLTPNGRIQEVLNNPNITGAKAPIFSLGTANPHDMFHFGQIADVTGDGSTFVMEDVQFGHAWYDGDYNDLIFQVRGATGEAPLMEDLIDPAVDWRDSDLGQALVSYATRYVEEVGVEDIGFSFSREYQPLVGIIDTGFSGDNPDLDYSNIMLGRDWIDGDDNPLLTAGEGNEHGTHVLGIIAAQRDNDIGIDGINPDAPIWLGRAVGSGQWANSLVEFVDAAVESGQPNAVVNLSLDLTQIDANGEVFTRYEFTPMERAAIEYARQNNVLLVVAAGNDGGVMSALGQASQEFDNIITVGAAESITPELEPFKGYQPTHDSVSGKALDLVADVASSLEGVPNLTVATAKVTGAVSQVWAANPDLNYTQVIDILKRTATDLGQPNWDIETGAGLLNIMAAIHLAKATKPEPYTVKPGQRTITDNFISSNPGNKPLPGDPTHPAATVPGIPETTVDTGGNSIKEATPLLMSPTVDIIDQVSSIDPVDVFRMESRYLQGADFSVLDGELSIKYLTPDGQLLGTQVLGKGSHKLELPANASGEVLMKVEQRNQAPATYMLYGFESTEPQPFNIDLELDGTLTASQKQILTAAAKNVAALIGQGLPTAIVDGKIIDDINIKISTAHLDGAGGTQARTKIDFMRYGSLLPAQSLVQFDAADIAELERSGHLFDVAQHEFLHALGFGNLWEAKGLIDYAGTPLAQYNGKNAVNEFQNMGGLTDAIALEAEGNGSASLHWHEDLFQDEIMTADLNGFAGGSAPISAVTIASLADLGYVVNLDRATPDYQLFGGQSFDGADLTPEQIEAFRALAEMSFDAAEDLGEDYEYIAPIMPTVDPDTVAPEIWAHAERFWKNKEYYDWVRYEIKPGDTISHIAQRTMGNGVDSHYWAFIGNKNGLADVNRIAAGDSIWIPKHHPNYAQKQEQKRKEREAELKKKQEEEAKKKKEQEEKLKQEAEQKKLKELEEKLKQEAAAKQKQLEEQARKLAEQREKQRQKEELEKEQARLREIERQKGIGGQDWYLATHLPEFGPVDPFESRISGETVGNLVPDDYYRFTLSRGGRITAELRQLLADADLILYDARNRPIAYSMREGVTDEHIIADLIPGTYMLRVNSPKGVTTDYELVVKFKHLLSRTEQGPPDGWQVGGGSGGAKGPLFSDPRIMRIYDTALNNFAGPERAKANAKIADLQREKRSYEQEMKALLDKMNSEQRAKVNKALDDARNSARSWVDGVANPIKNSVSSLGNGIKNKADSVANSLISAINKIPDLGWNWAKNLKEDARKLVRRGRDAVKNAVNSAQTWLNGQLTNIQNNVKSAISTFFDTVKNAYRTGAEINQAIANAANSFRSAVDRAVRGANDLVSKFKGRVLSAVESTKNLGINIDILGKKLGFNVYNQVVKPAVDAISSGVSSTINGIGNGLKGITDWLEPRTQKAVAAFVDALFGDKTGHLWNKIHGVDAKIAATRTGLEKAIANKANELKNQMLSFLSSLGSEGKKILDAILDFGNSSPSQFSAIALELLLGMAPIGSLVNTKDTILGLLKMANGDSGINTSVSLLGALAGSLPRNSSLVQSIAKESLNGGLPTLLAKLDPDSVTTVSKELAQADWNKVAHEAIGVIGKKWDDFARVIQNAPNWAIDGLKKAFPWVNALLNLAGQGVDKVKSIGSWIGSKFNDAVDWLTKKLNDWIAEQEAQRKAKEEEAQRKAKEDAQRKAEEEAKRKAEEEARLGFQNSVTLPFMLNNIGLWGSGKKGLSGGNDWGFDNIGTTQPFGIGEFWINMKGGVGAYGSTGTADIKLPGAFDFTFNSASNEFGILSTGIGKGETLLSSYFGAGIGLDFELGAGIGLNQDIPLIGGTNLNWKTGLELDAADVLLGYFAPGLAQFIDLDTGINITDSQFKDNKLEGEDNLGLKMSLTEPLLGLGGKEAGGIKLNEFLSLDLGVYLNQKTSFELSGFRFDHDNDGVHDFEVKLGSSLDLQTLPSGLGNLKVQPIGNLKTDLSFQVVPEFSASLGNVIDSLVPGDKDQQWIKEMIKINPGGINFEGKFTTLPVFNFEFDPFQKSNTWLSFL